MLRKPYNLASTLAILALTAVGCSKSEENSPAAGGGTGQPTSAASIVGQWDPANTVTEATYEMKKENNQEIQKITGSKERHRFSYGYNVANISSSEISFESHSGSVVFYSKKGETAGKEVGKVSYSFDGKIAKLSIPAEVPAVKTTSAVIDSTPVAAPEATPAAEQAPVTAEAPKADAEKAAAPVVVEKLFIRIPYLNPANGSRDLEIVNSQLVMNDDSTLSAQLMNGTNLVTVRFKKTDSKLNHAQVSAALDADLKTATDNETALEKQAKDAEAFRSDLCSFDKDGKAIGGLCPDSQASTEAMLHNSLVEVATLNSQLEIFAEYDAARVQLEKNLVKAKDDAEKSKAAQEALNIHNENVEAIVKSLPAEMQSTAQINARIDSLSKQVSDTLNNSVEFTKWRNKVGAEQPTTTAAVRNQFNDVVAKLAEAKAKLAKEAAEAKAKADAAKADATKP